MLNDVNRIHEKKKNQEGMFSTSVTFHLSEELMEEMHVPHRTQLGKSIFVMKPRMLWRRDVNVDHKFKKSQTSVL